MPTIAIACPISRLPHKSRSRCVDRIRLFTRTAPDPCHGIRAQPSAGADDRQGKEDSKDYMDRHQQPVDGGNTETKRDLIAPPSWRCSGVSHHVERVENKSDTGHWHQRRAERSVKEKTPQRGLCDKATEPRSN